MNRDQNKTKNKLNQSIIEIRLGREKALRILIDTRIRRKEKKGKEKKTMMAAIAGYLRNRKQHPCHWLESSVLSGELRISMIGGGGVFFCSFETIPLTFLTSPIILDQDRYALSLLKICLTLRRGVPCFLFCCSGPLVFERYSLNLTELTIRPFCDSSPFFTMLSKNLKRFWEAYMRAR